MGWGFPAKKYKALHLRRAVTLPENSWLQSCEPKKDLKVTAGKTSHITQFLCVMLLSDAGKGQKLRYFWMCTYEGMIWKSKA